MCLVWSSMKTFQHFILCLVSPLCCHVIVEKRIIRKENLFNLFPPKNIWNNNHIAHILWILASMLIHYGTYYIEKHPKKKKIKDLQNIITQVPENYHIPTHKAHRCDVCAFQCFHIQHILRVCLCVYVCVSAPMFAFGTTILLLATIVWRMALVYHNCSVI